MNLHPYFITATWFTEQFTVYFQGDRVLVLNMLHQIRIETFRLNFLTNNKPNNQDVVYSDLDSEGLGRALLCTSGVINTEAYSLLQAVERSDTAKFGLQVFCALSCFRWLFSAVCFSCFLCLLFNEQIWLLSTINAWKVALVVIR